jgi:hypothetical protein
MVLKKIFFVMAMFLYTQIAAQGQTDLIVFSYDRPLQLYACLESVEKNIQDLASVAVLYRTSSPAFDEAYTLVIQRFPTVLFFKQAAPEANTFKPTLCNIAYNILASPYIMFGVDDIIVTETITLNECVRALENYNAYGFYLRLGKNITQCYTLSVYKDFTLPMFDSLDFGIFRWHLAKAPYDWSYTHSLDMTVFRKADLQGFITMLEYTTPNSLDFALNQYTNPDWQGLCYEHSKIVNIPLNIVQENRIDHNMALLSTVDLLEEFMLGFKIDIQALAGVDNKSPHHPYIPQFTNRSEH